MKETSSSDYDFNKDMFIGQLDLIQLQINRLPSLEKGIKDSEFNEKHRRERQIKNKLQDIINLIYDANYSNSYQYFSVVITDPNLSSRINAIIKQFELNGKEVPLKLKGTLPEIDHTNIKITIDYPKNVSK